MISDVLTGLFPNPLCQTMDADIAITRYRVIQAGANSQLGGVKGGLSKVTYQVEIAGVVNIEPTRPAHWHTIILMISLMAYLTCSTSVFYPTYTSVWSSAVCSTIIKN